jgi:hypothetical protein
VVTTLVPEGVEDGLVSTSASICDHVEEKGYEKLEGERPAAREILFSLPEDAGFGSGQKAGECCKIINDFARAGMGVEDRILCRSCEVS